MSVSRPGVRTWAASLAAAAVFATAGCGTGSLRPSHPHQEPPNTLTMWTFKQTHVDALEAAAAAFKKQTGITVKVSAYTPDDTFSSKIQSGAATGYLADVIEDHAGGEDFTYGGAGIAADLAPLLPKGWQQDYLPGTADTGLVTDRVYQNSLSAQASDPGVKVGQVFSVPLTAGTFGIVYANRKALTAAGLDPDHPPTTWEQWMGWLKATHAADPQHGGVTIGLQDSSTAFDWLLEPMAYAYLGKQKYEALFGKDDAANWSGAGGQAVLKVYDEITPYWTPGTQTLGIDDADRAFAQGKSAFDIGGTFTLSSVQQDGMDPDDVVAFPVPGSAHGAIKDLKMAPVALTGLSVSATTSNRAAALKWVEFLTAPAQAAAFAKSALDLPGTDLGPDAAAVVGPHMAALEGVFGAAGPDTWNPIDTTFMAPSYDPTQVGDVVEQMSPLKSRSPASAAHGVGVVIDNSWK